MALFLAMLAVLLAAGFVLAPRALAGAGPANEHSLSVATSQAFTAYWQSGRHSYPPALADLVAYWRRAGRLRPATTTAAVVSGSTVTALTFGSVLAVMANIQGALAPFTSLVSLLPGRPGRR